MATVNENALARRRWNERWVKHHGRPYPHPQSVAFPAVAHPQFASAWYWDVGVRHLGFDPALSPMVLLRPNIRVFYQDFVGAYASMVERRGLRSAMLAQVTALRNAGAIPAEETRPELP